MTSAVAKKTGSSFISDVSALRARARQHIEDGAVTQSYARTARRC
jgi:hypothetical protein